MTRVFAFFSRLYLNPIYFSCKYSCGSPFFLFRSIFVIKFVPERLACIIWMLTLCEVAKISPVRLLGSRQNDFLISVSFSLSLSLSLSLSFSLSCLSVTKRRGSECNLLIESRSKAASSSASLSGRGSIETLSETYYKASCNSYG